jgi:hypothetical protein
VLITDTQAVLPDQFSLLEHETRVNQYDMRAVAALMLFQFVKSFIACLSLLVSTHNDVTASACVFSQLARLVSVVTICPGWD